MAERGEIPYQCKSKANYEVIALGKTTVEENQNSFQYTYSFRVVHSKVKKLYCQVNGKKE
jgi:hypothetical protein